MVISLREWDTYRTELTMLLVYEHALTQLFNSIQLRTQKLIGHFQIKL